MIKFIFGIRLELPVLAHSSRHRVTGLTLPPVDANTFFHHLLQLAWSNGEESIGANHYRICPRCLHVQKRTSIAIPHPVKTTMTNGPTKSRNPAFTSKRHLIYGAPSHGYPF